ncbi:hypothetical protein N9B21_02350 [Verrucomicrobiales bacterium]|nr:hypothetical protein [Verrucomicrobiales bacterium]MDA7926858.1 hypothetical protein [Verrucomicrobiales bacterium]
MHLYCLLKLSALLFVMLILSNCGAVNAPINAVSSVLNATANTTANVVGAGVRTAGAVVGAPLALMQ